MSINHRIPMRLDHIYIDLVRIYSLNNRNHLGYIKRRSALLQVDLDLNAITNGSQESAGRNAETGGTQNGQPNPGSNNPGGQRSTSAFDRLGPGHPEPRPFGGIGSDDTQIM
ncbi:hypothetical protein PIB30_004423 [Stylosanthes scabra]|uniref:Uncharacterized protein n=1 Tax=Stylosanthes scabra TaxID=79078 RepID=A0ABU6V2F1_9FABA|nr:hypothetical protein [Stylosanthes scabra]